MSNELIQSRFTKRNMAKKHLLIAVSISARWHLVTTMSLNPTSWQILLTTQQRLHCGAKTLCGSLLSMYSPGDVVKKNIFFSCSGIPSCQQHLGLLANDHLAHIHSPAKQNQSPWQRNGKVCLKPATHEPLVRPHREALTSGPDVRL